METENAIHVVRLVPLHVAARRLGVGGRDPARALRRRIRAYEDATKRRVIVRRARRGPGAFMVDMAELRREMPELFGDVQEAGRAEANRLLRSIVGELEAASGDLLEAVTGALGDMTAEMRVRLREMGPK